VANSVRLLTFIIFLNIFLYLGVNYIVYQEAIEQGTRPPLQGDIFDYVFEDEEAFDANMENYITSLEEEGNYTTGYKFEFEGNLSSPPNEAGGQDTAAEGINIIFKFLDGLKMVMRIITTFWRIAFAPLSFFDDTMFPPLVGFIIGVPLVLIELWVLIVFIRGGGAI
jgi:hypothetical protein